MIFCAFCLGFPLLEYIPNIPPCFTYVIVSLLRLRGKSKMSTIVRTSGIICILNENPMETTDVTNQLSSVTSQIKWTLWQSFICHVPYLSKSRVTGEWHGLVVIVEACHSKGRGFESGLFLFLLRGHPEASIARWINFWEMLWIMKSREQRDGEEEPAGKRGMKNTKGRKMVRTKQTI